MILARAILPEAPAFPVGRARGEKDVGSPAEKVGVALAGYPCASTAGIAP